MNILNKLGINRLVLSNRKIIYYNVLDKMDNIRHYKFYNTKGNMLLSFDLNNRLCSIHIISSLYTYEKFNETQQNKKLLNDTCVLILKKFPLTNNIAVNYASWQGSNNSKKILLEAGFEINGVFDSCHGESNLSLLVKRHKQLNGDLAIKNSINHLEKLLTNGETLDEKNEK